MTDFYGAGSGSGINSIGDAEDVLLTDVKDGDTITYNSAIAKFVNRPSTYVHTQSTAASVWTITHNMGKYPSVMVVDSAKNVVYGDVKYDGLNRLTLTFSATFSGYAYLN